MAKTSPYYDNPMDNMILVDKREFEDICLSAFRYALYRHTYILDFTLDFIERNSINVVTDRTKSIMLRDIEERLRLYENEEEVPYGFDEERIKIFRDWLVNYDGC